MDYSSKEKSVKLWPRHFHRFGFTLLETLLAITIGTIILTAVFTLFRSAIISWSLAKYDAKCMKVARMVFTLLEEDLRDIVKETGKTSPFLPQPFSGGAHLAASSGINFEFVAARSPSESGQGWHYEKIEYFFYYDSNNNPQDYMMIRRIDQGPIPDGTYDVAQNLAYKKEFSKIEAKFLKWNENDQKFTTYPAWPVTETGLPHAIGIKLIFQEKRGYQPQWTKTFLIPRAMGQ